MSDETLAGRIKNVLPRTLLARSLLILVTPILLLQAITTYIFFDRHWQKMGDRMAFSIAGEIALIAERIERGVDPTQLAVLQNSAAENLNLFIQFRENEALTSLFEGKRHGIQNASRENIISDSLASAFARQLLRPYDIAVDENEKWVEVRVQLSNGVMTVTMPERRIFSSSGYIVLLWMVSSSLILLVIAIFFMRNQIRPIRRLAVAAERIGKGRDVPFFKIEGAREVRQAAKAFVDMRDRLKRQVQQRTALLAGVSHDLRTPLTRMKLQLEMMGSGPDVVDLKNDLSDMERMIEAYLQFARGEGAEEPVRTDLTALLAQVTRNANRERERVFLDCAEDLSVLLRPIAFERAVGNLIGNALKYGQQAWITARRFGEVIEICIDDDGPGVPESQYEDVFRPFFRGEGSRNQKTGGVGLGLPIVQDIVLAHGGQIWLDRSARGGLRVVIDLPV